MTTKQLDELARAEAIAQRDGLHAIKGSDGHYAVLNRSATKRNGYPTYHVLRVIGSQITCDCYAAQAGRICAHRAAVRMALVIEAELERVAIEQQQRGEQTLARRRESSAAARPAAFSIFK